MAAAKPLSPNEVSQSHSSGADDDDAKQQKGKAGTKSKEREKEKDSDHIKVICRFRPPNNKELAEEKRQNLSTTQSISVYNEGKSLEVPRKSKNKPTMNFTLDNVIWHSQSQQDTFNELAQPTVDNVIEGYNCTIFAFGQTGSGKTYTMFGPDNYARVAELGIIPRSVDYMFKQLNSKKSILKFQISLSIVEVYKEMLRDLLSSEKQKNRRRLEILSAGKDVSGKNLTEKPWDSVADILKLIVVAQSNRAKHTTEFIGHDSSRSHCVVMISVTQRLLDDTIKFSKLNFGDLAGSELAAKTNTKGTSLKEAGKIHQGLLALENVINALVEKKKHVPYNDSKLTRLLSTSIGGNAKTTLLVTCSPSIWNRDETISTLRFAKRAKKIKNKAKINKRQTREQLLRRIAVLENENANLKKKISKHKFGGTTSSSMRKNHSMNVIAGDDAQIFGMTLEEKEKNDALLHRQKEEILKLKEGMDRQEDRMKQMELDLEMKQEVVFAFDAEKKEYEQRIRDLTSENQQNAMEIDKLQTKLESNLELQTSFNSHTENLSNIVNDSVKDSNSAMVSALTEITKQQAEFYKFLKDLGGSIDKIHAKQISDEQHVNDRFDDVNQILLGLHSNHSNNGNNHSKYKYHKFRDDDEVSVSYNPNDHDRDEELSVVSNSEFDPVTPRGHYAQESSFNFDENMLQSLHGNHERDLSVNSLVMSPEQLALERTQEMERESKHKHGHSKAATVNRGDAEVLTDLISSMRDYLDKTRERELTKTADADDKDKDKNEEFKINDEDAKQYKSNFSVGKKVDVLDVSYNWYPATIIDIDVFDKKAVFIKYDDFEDMWNEWVPLRYAINGCVHFFVFSYFYWL